MQASGCGRTGGLVAKTKWENQCRGDRIGVKRKVNTPCLQAKYAVFADQIRRVCRPNTPCLLSGTTCPALPFAAACRVAGADGE